MSATRKVTLGEHEVDVYPQRQAYLTNKLGRFIGGLMGTELEDTNGEAIVAFLGDNAYDLLATVIPTYGKRCPKYEFAGYASQAAYEAREYDEREDKSPTFPEIVTAFEVAAEANRFDVLKTLGKIVDPKLLRTWINTKVSEAILTSSANSQLPAAGSPSTSSGATTPTSTENGAPLSDDSATSPTPTSAAVPVT